MTEKMSNKDESMLSLDKKFLLTKHEAAAYTSIGINKLENLLRTPSCPFVLYVGSKKLIKRKEFEEFISEKTVI